VDGSEATVQCLVRLLVSRHRIDGPGEPQEDENEAGDSEDSDAKELEDYKTESESEEVKRMKRTLGEKIMPMMGRNHGRWKQ
jgi:hypothetical protein